jgi:phage terminase small subunit
LPVHNIRAIPAELDEVGELGPAMRALNERRRRFVLALAENPDWPYGRAAKAAGYGTGMSNDNTLRVIGRRLAQEEQVIEALREETSKRFRVRGAIVTMRGMFAIAQDRTHKDHFRALEWLGNRAGFHEMSEHKITVERTDRTGTAMIERIKYLAEQLGIDPAQLLGANGMSALPKLIEGSNVPSTRDDDEAAA